MRGNSSKLKKKGISSKFNRTQKLKCILNDYDGGPSVLIPPNAPLSIYLDRDWHCGITYPLGHQHIPSWVLNPSGSHL